MSMNYQQALGYLHSACRFNGAPTLERMRELMHRLGDVQTHMHFVHVAGTNGKGSTACMLARVLEKAGYKTGLFVSPYVYDFRERISVNGSMIPKDNLIRLCERVRAAADDMTQPPTAFELVSAVGFLYFAEQNCDITVLEVGLGGRFDATNIIKTPLLSIITAVSIDHTAVLGNTLSEIAFEKCGIIKEDGCVICCPSQTPEIISFIRKVSEQRNNRFILPDRNALQIFSSDMNGLSFAYRDKPYILQLIGDFQADNAATVIEAASALSDFGFKITKAQLHDGLVACKMNARFEKVCDCPPIFLDAGHNPQSVDQLLRLLSPLRTRGITMIFTVMKDKDYVYAIDRLSRYTDHFFAVAPTNCPRALAPSEICALAEKHCADTRSFSEVGLAVSTALQTVGSGVLIICGSFYLISEAKENLKKLPELCIF